MLIRVKPRNAGDFTGDLGEYNVITGKLTVWFSRAYLKNEDKELTIKDFDIPKDCKKVELVDLGSNEQLAVPLSEFKRSHKKNIGYIFNYEDWKKRYIKHF